MKTTKGSLIKLANPIIKNKELIPKIKNYLQKDSAYIYIYIKNYKKGGRFCDEHRRSCGTQKK